MTTLSDFHAQTLAGDDQALATYAGQVVLVVNTASKCGFTPQYAGLEKLYEAHKDEGLVVLGFPCNQFGGQEPGSEDEISEFCQVNYGVSFPMFSKIDVNGSDRAPLYAWLVDSAPEETGEDIGWNFTKFLLGRDGTVLHRYASDVTPEQLEQPVAEALAG
jgi:glutathione peroxidase